MIEIRAASLADPVVAALTAASVAEMASRYGGRPGSGAPPRAEEFEPPVGAFLLARLEGKPVGCGGISRFDEETAELRRMYVVPAARGRGISRAVLTRLLDDARALGYVRVRLETGDRQPEALGLYVSTGFERIPCWGPYATDERSICLERTI